MTESNCCRLCGGVLIEPALLIYTNSPQSAQGFLDNLDQADDTVDLKIQECLRCGLVQHSHPPVVYYRDVIRAIAFSEEMGQFRLKQLSEWIEKFNLQDKQVLEVGCGKGEYLDLLIRSGARYVKGIEHAFPSVEEARQRGFDVQQAYLSPAYTNPWDQTFDAFAIFSFMEHWPDLNGSLCALQGILNEKAYGLIEVPNFEFILANGLYSEFTTDHIFYFDRQTLKLALELNGFEVLSIEPIWHDYILSAQVIRRKPLNADIFTKKQEQIVRSLDQFVGRFEPEDIVVWGAGHQSLAVMSLAGLQNKVSHVVDSATF